MLEVLQGVSADGNVYEDAWRGIGCYKIDCTDYENSAAVKEFLRIYIRYEFQVGSNMFVGDIVQGGTRIGGVGQEAAIRMVDPNAQWLFRPETWVPVKLPGVVVASKTTHPSGLGAGTSWGWRGFTGTGKLVNTVLGNTASDVISTIRRSGSLFPRNGEEISMMAYRVRELLRWNKNNAKLLFPNGMPVKGPNESANAYLGRLAYILMEDTLSEPVCFQDKKLLVDAQLRNVRYKMSGRRGIAIHPLTEEFITFFVE